jgi:predicted dehydrogenase
MKKLEVIELDRRDFLKGTSASVVTAALSGVALNKAWAQDEAAADSEKSKIKVGIIGCGYHGRDIIRTLATVPSAELAAICETYPAYLRRAARAAPKAEKFSDYKKLLAREDIPAVIIATPSHKHRQIALEAMRAGKHVYLEAPIATTVADSKAIAAAAKSNSKVHFQAGLHFRSDPQRLFVMEFVRTGSMGNQATGRGQWSQKTSWRRGSPNRDREKELNWRIDSKTSGGLISEVGIHHLDAATWLYGGVPKAVTGFGSITGWNDGRDVDDTINAIFEYDKGTIYNFSATIASSFEAAYEVYQGNMATVMFKDGSKGWMFKEADSQALGWEVYAQKDEFYNETGIALIADATKQATRFGDKADQAPEPTPLYHALESFATNAIVHKAAVEDFASFYDISDVEALSEYMTDLDGSKSPYAGPDLAYQSVVTAITANEAIRTKRRIEIDPKSLVLG